MLPVSCLLRIFFDDVGPQPGIQDCIALFLFLTAPLLFGLSRSFANIRKRALIDRADASILASTAIFSGLAVSLLGAIVKLDDASIPIRELLLPTIVIGADCGIFWLLTRIWFKKMQRDTAPGFPVVSPRQ
jgi:hypothetical protein